MQTTSSTSRSATRSRRARLLGAALVGTVLSLGAVADSASAASRISASTTVNEGEAPRAIPSFARASGIRW